MSGNPWVDGQGVIEVDAKMLLVNLRDGPYYTECLGE